MKMLWSEDAYGDNKVKHYTTWGIALIELLCSPLHNYSL